MIHQILFWSGIIFICLVLRCTCYITCTIVRRRLKKSQYPSYYKQFLPTTTTLHVDDDSTLDKSRVMLVLGSGGHTSEMLLLTKSFDRSQIYSISYLIANTDQTSYARAQQQESKLRQEYFEQHPDLNEAESGYLATRRFHDFLNYTEEEEIEMAKAHYADVRYDFIPRAREVGQSYLSAVFTTIAAFFDVIEKVYIKDPHLLVVNGPGLCVPVCFATLFFNLLGITSTHIIYVESLTRVTGLSLTGRILYYWVDRFVVHWPSLASKYPLAEYVGVLY